MNITRKLDTSNATYDIEDLSDKDFRTLCKAYEYYIFATQRSFPGGDDSLWSKMRKLLNETIKTV